MVTAQLSKICTGELKDSIADLAAGFVKDPTAQADLYYTAWIAIAKAEGDYTPEYYYYCAYRIMRKRYELIYMPIPQAGKYKSDDPGLRRVKRRRRFYRRTR